MNHSTVRVDSAPVAPDVLIEVVMGALNFFQKLGKGSLVPLLQARLDDHKAAFYVKRTRF